jgi:hypothetical protein
VELGLEPLPTEAGLTALLGPCALSVLFAAALLAAFPGLVPDAELAWVAPVAISAIWPRLILRELRNQASID